MRVRGVLIVLTGFRGYMLAYRLVCTVFTEYVSVCMCSWLYAQVAGLSSLKSSMSWSYTDMLDVLNYSFLAGN
jgi:hypothetical protein